MPRKDIKNKINSINTINAIYNYTIILGSFASLQWNGDIIGNKTWSFKR